MPIDTILVIGAGIDEVVGKTGNSGELVAGLWIKVSVPSTSISSPWPMPMLAKLAELYAPTGMSPAP